MEKNDFTPWLDPDRAYEDIQARIQSCRINGELNKSVNLIRAWLDFLPGRMISQMRRCRFLPIVFLACQNSESTSAPVRSNGRADVGLKWLK